MKRNEYNNNFFYSYGGEKPWNYIQNKTLLPVTESHSVSLKQKGFEEQRQEKIITPDDSESQGTYRALMLFKL